MDPITIGLTLDALAALAFVALFALFRGPETGPGTHRWKPKHAAPRKPTTRTADPDATVIIPALTAWPAWR